VAQWLKRIGAMSLLNVSREAEGAEETGVCPRTARTVGPTKDKPENESMNRYETTV
jgi:hypothetical protein